MKTTSDPRKREWTLRERGLDLAEAAEVFAGPHTVLADERFEYGENRFVSAGYLRGPMVVIVWTPRGDARHVISMRYCHEKEAKRWRKYLGE